MDPYAIEVYVAALIEVRGVKGAVPKRNPPNRQVFAPEKYCEMRTRATRPRLAAVLGAREKLGPLAVNDPFSLNGEIFGINSIDKGIVTEGDIFNTLLVMLDLGAPKEPGRRGKMERYVALELDGTNQELTRRH
jgi:hypothetical protein